MCRYAFKKYKPHFVCFECRKQFKRPRLEDVLAEKGTLDTYLRLLRARSRSRSAKVEQESEATLESMAREYRALVSRCPQCAREMADLGLDFKPPRSSATRAWERLRALYRMGDRAWYTCGCNGPGYIPINQTDHAAYLRERLATYTDRMNSVMPEPALEAAYRQKQVRYWADLVEKVKAELAESGTRAGRRRAGAA
jgi:hypothetical protein